MVKVLENVFRGIIGSFAVITNQICGDTETRRLHYFRAAIFVLLLRAQIWKPHSKPHPGGLPYERAGDARRLASGCKFQILFSLRVFWAKHHYI